MTPRKFLGALALGLPAAVGAHFVTFGGAHTLGGSVHGVVIDGMLAVLCASVVALCLGSFYVAAAYRNGSIVAARLERFLPGTLGAILSGVFWFGLIERMESPHHIPFGAAALVLILVATLLRAAFSATIRAVAQLALLFLKRPFTPRDVARYSSLVRVRPAATRPPLAITRFSRPPPSFS